MSNRARTGLVTEAQFQQTVIAACKTYGLRHYHTHDSRRSVPGFPDLVIVGPAGVLFRELKTATGRVSHDQQEWIRALTEAGCDVAVWRPADLVAGIVQSELELLRRPRGSGSVGVVQTLIAHGFTPEQVDDMLRRKRGDA